MRTLARAVTYTLLAAVVAMSASVTWTTGTFWLVMLACVGTGIGILAGKSIQAGRDLDDFLEDERLEQSVADYHCVAHGHYYRKVEGVWLCLTCGDTVRPIEVPFDQDGDAA